MDSLRSIVDDFGAAAEEDPAYDRLPEIGVDERRMRFRAYDYRVSLLAGRDYPSVEDLDLESEGDLACAASCSTALAARKSWNAAHRR